MLKFGNKEFRNLQEQVEENMKDIANLKSGQAVLDEFGIKVVGEVESVDDLPTVSEYKELAPDWEYGDAYAVGTVAPYTLYILTRANGSHDEDYWFDIGEFPAPGPQGPQGPQGPEGQQGQTGDTGPAGADAGFGVPTATATMTAKGSAPTVNVTASGPNTEKVFNFDFYLPVATPKVTITSASGTLTLADYNILYNFEDSVVVFKPSSSLAHTAYTLQRWYANDDYIVFICLYNYTPYKTAVYRCRVDRSNRNYLIYADEAIKINKWNISTAINSTTNETAGKVLTADGNGGASWETAGGGGTETVTLTTTVGNLSNSDYIKVAGNGCVIIYDDNTTKVYFKKYDETSTTITYATIFSEGSSTYNYGVEITKATKYYQIASAYMPISNSNIKSGSTIADKYLKTNGSGGAVWGDAPSQVQSDWNESSQSSPAYIKNKPTIPTVPVTDVTVNGTSVMDGTTAKVLVDTVDGATDGTNWTSLTINGTTAAIPQSSTQVQADWTESDITDPSYIQNKPTLATVATSGSYNDLSNKPTIPAAQVNSDWDAISGVAQILNKPTLGTAAAKDYTSSVTSGSADLVTSGAVYTVIDNIPEPMIFKGSLGTGGTITSLPTASSANEGFVYKVIEDGTYASQAAKEGDTFISDGSNWVLIPSGDEPSGTVTSVGMTVPTGLTVSGSPITSSGTLAIALDTGYEIPTTTTLNSFAVAANLATVATSGSYNDLSNKPTIPDVSNMVTTDTTQTISGTKAFKSLVVTDNYNDNTSLIAGNDLFTIQVDGGANTFNFSDTYLSTTNNNQTDLGTSIYKFKNLYLAGNLSDGTNSIAIADIANKSNIPSISGTNDGTNWTSLTINSDTYSIPGNSTPSNMVTTNTDQSITGIKTFTQSLALRNGININSGDGIISYGSILGSNNNITFRTNTGTLNLIGGNNIRLRNTANPNSNLYGLVVPSTSSFTADKTIATTDQIPTVPTNISSFNNDSGYITGITSGNVTIALGYTPLANTACTYQTTAPTAAISDGGVHIVYLSSEPSTKYSGYIYMIAEA